MTCQNMGMFQVSPFVFLKLGENPQFVDDVFMKNSHLYGISLLNMFDYQRVTKKIMICLTM